MEACLRVRVIYKVGVGKEMPSNWQLGKLKIRKKP